MPGPAFPPAPRPRTRVLMAVHSAERGGAQLVALAQARALRRECDLVIAVGAGPLRARVRRSGHRDRPRADISADLGRVVRPVGAPDRPFHPGRGAARTAREAASDRRRNRQQHCPRGPGHRRPAGRRSGHRACAGGAQDCGRQATVPRARRAGAHRRRDLAVDRTGLRRRTRERRAESGRDPHPGRSGAARVVRRRSGPARADRHRGSPQAPGRRDRRRPGAARARDRGRADASRDRGRRRLRGRAPRSGARPRCGAAGPLRGADLRRRRPTAGRGRTAAPGGRGDAARPHGGDGAQDPGGRGAHGQHPRRRHRRGEWPAGRSGRPGRACRGSRSPSAGGGPCATGSPKRGAAVWSGTSTRRRRTSGWAPRSRGSPPAEPTGRECAPWTGGSA